jgi:hypothetical protein
MAAHRSIRTATALVACAILTFGQRAHAGKDNASSTCLNITQNVVDNGCYVLTPPISTSALVIDGADTGGTEWTGVAGLVTKNPTGTLTGPHTVRVRHESTVVAGQVVDSLVLFVTISDGSNDPDDKLQIVIDPLHNDHVPTANAIDDDIVFTLFRGADSGPGQIHAPKRFAVAGGDVEWVPTAGHGAFAVTSSAADWQVELRIDPTELLTSQLPSAVGYGVKVSDFNGDGAVWPLNFAVPNVITVPFANLAVLKNRRPIDYALSLDFSGSMTATDGLTENRWKRAVHAANTFITVASLFRDPDYFDDRVGASQYSWKCSDNNTTGDGTKLFGSGAGPALGDFPAPGADLLAVGSDPPGDNCTPIKRGLEFAYEKLATASLNGATDRDRLVVLLSDGFHNMPASSASFGTDPVPSFNNSGFSGAKLRTVSLGPDLTAGTALLGRLAVSANGVADDKVAKYNQLSTAEDLLDPYLEVLGQPLHVNKVPAEVDGTYLPGTVERLVFIGGWIPQSAAQGLTIERADSAGGPFTPVAGTSTTPNTVTGFTAVVIDHPTAGGVWRFGGGAPLPNARHVLADLRAFAEFFTEPKIHNTGDPILLQVRVRDAGSPALGAEVMVETASPGQGLGNFLSTTDDRCEVSTPKLPTLTRGIDITKATPGTPAVRGATAGVTADPRPGRYALAQQLLERCQKTDVKVTVPGTPMFDDATHGDLVAGDGVYSLASPTKLEGSYNFRIRVRGTEATGAKFSRASLLSQYVQVAPTQTATATTVQVGNIVNGLQTAVVLFIPKDDLGNYVGPGMQTNYHVNVTGGTTLARVVDLGRGVYGQQIGYPVKTATPPITIVSDEPRVTIVVGGKGGSGGTTGPGGDHCAGCPGGADSTGHPGWFARHCCLVLTILVGVLLLLLLLLVLARRRRP